MLVKFSVSNYRSIYNAVTLQMSAGRATGKEADIQSFFRPEKYHNTPLLNTAVIYGANASGKSTLLKAIGFFRSFVANSPNRKFNEGLPFEPFKLSRSAWSQPTTFEIEFILPLDDIKYNYKFSFNEREILSESLTSFLSRKGTVLFNREKGKEVLFSSSFKGPKKNLVEQLQSNHLLLSKAAISNNELLRPLYNYFIEHIKLNLTHHTHPVDTQKRAFSSDAYKETICRLLQVADVGIDSFIVNKLDPSELPVSMEGLSDDMKESFSDYLSYKTNVVHKVIDSDDNATVSWSLDEESTGTIKLFSIAAPIVDALRNGRTLIFDEINNSMHPLLTEMLVSLFNNPETNANNAQLIFTTHDTTLLGKKVFRRDQIWFTEKDESGATQLFSLSKFDKTDVKWDIPFDKWYLSGRFGALPLVSDFKINQ